MRRRQVLRALTVAAGPLVTGCLSERRGAASEEPSPSAAASPSVTETTGERTPTDAPASLTGYSFSVEQVLSGQETQAATISVGSNTTVEGRITGASSCHTAEVADVSVTGDTLSVTVRSRKAEDAGDACSQQLVVVHYRASFEFAGDGPGTVVVYHDSLGNRREVARSEA